MEILQDQSFCRSKVRNRIQRIEDEKVIDSCAPEIVRERVNGVNGLEEGNSGRYLGLPRS